MEKHEKLKLLLLVAENKENTELRISFNQIINTLRIPIPFGADMEKTVFIANVSENNKFATELHSFLERHGIKCFQYTIDLLPGDNIKQETKKNIEESDHCIICFSKEFNARKKSDMHREIYIAIGDTYQRKPNSGYLIPVRVNDCNIEDYEINATTSMKDLWCPDFSKNSDKARQALLNKILGLRPESSAKINANAITPHLIRLRQDDKSSLKFPGFLLGECTNARQWKIQVYETAEDVKECKYIIYVDRTNAKVVAGQQKYTVNKFDSLDSIKTSIYKVTVDKDCAKDILDMLGIEDYEYLE